MQFISVFNSTTKRNAIHNRCAVQTILPLD